MNNCLIKMYCDLEVSFERIAQGGPYVKKRLNTSNLDLEMPVCNCEMNIQDLNSPSLFRIVILKKVLFAFLVQSSLAPSSQGMGVKKRSFCPGHC